MTLVNSSHDQSMQYLTTVYSIDEYGMKYIDDYNEQ